MIPTLPLKSMACTESPNHPRVTLWNSRIRPLPRPFTANARQWANASHRRYGDHMPLSLLPKFGTCPS